MRRLPTLAFLDRDGVINEKPADHTYVTNWEDFRFLPGAVPALKALASAGVRLVIVTNQRGIALGRMTYQSVVDIHEAMAATLAKADVAFSAILVCPHDEGACECRKPALGLFRQAQHLLPSVDLQRAVVIGDSPSDIAAANRLGCPAFLVGDEVVLAALDPELRVAGSGRSLVEIVEKCLGLPVAYDEASVGSARD